MRFSFAGVSLALGWSVVFALVGCGKGATPGSVKNPSFRALPWVTPPVKAATPAGLRGANPGSRVHRPGDNSALLSATDFKSRFFSGNGPTDVLGTLLPSLDGLITGINTQLSSTGSACVSQEPIQYSINPFGQTIIMYAQCFNQMAPSYPGDPAFVQFGVADGGTYIYAANGAEWEAAIVTPTAVDGGIGLDGGQYSVRAWLGLGYSNVDGCSSTWDGCSYAGMELYADSSTNTLELAVAGMGIGYCGAQLRSDGTDLWAEGSGDMGNDCAALDNLCVAASDATTPATCAAPLTTFALQPIGRESTLSTAPVVTGVWGATAYPAIANVLFNGTTDDAIHFGPNQPTPGVGNLQSTGSDGGP